MEFVRKVVDVTDLKNVIEIPNSLANKKVEILIFPIEEIKPKKKNKKSAAGMLSKYGWRRHMNDCYRYQYYT